MTDEQQPEPDWLQTLREMNRVGGPWFAQTVREVTRAAIAEIERLRAENAVLNAECNALSMEVDCLKADVERMTVTWTDEKPTEPGDWWYRDRPDQEGQMFHVRKDRYDEWISYKENESYNFVEWMTGQWSDKPIPLPREKKGASDDDT